MGLFPIRKCRYIQTDKPKDQQSNQQTDTLPISWMDTLKYLTCIFELVPVAQHIAHAQKTISGPGLRILWLRFLCKGKPKIHESVSEPKDYNKITCELPIHEF